MLEDLETFFTDFAVDAEFGGRSFKVILDVSDDVIIDGRVIDRQYEMVFKQGDFDGLTYESEVVIDSVIYKANTEPMAIDDGKLFKVFLRKV
jgi:hypothetical protein